MAGSIAGLRTSSYSVSKNSDGLTKAARTIGPMAMLLHVVPYRQGLGLRKRADTALCTTDYSWVTLDYL